MCLLWGDWKEPDRYVHTLKNMVERHLTVPHRFVCLSDRKINGIECLPLKYEWKKKLTKLAMFDTSYGLEGRVLFIDLDVVIVSNINAFAEYDGDYCTLMDFNEGNRMPMCGLDGFRAGDKYLEEKLFTPVTKDSEKAFKNSNGGMVRYWMRHQLEHWDLWNEQVPNFGIYSAKPDKYNVRKEIPADTKMIFFHGRQKNHDYTHLDWVRENWK